MGNKQCLCVCVNVVQIKSFAHFAVMFTLKPAAATHFHRHKRVYGFISIFEFIQNSTSSIVYAYGTYKHQRFTTHHGWPRMTIDKRCQLIRITSNKMGAGAMDNMKQRMQWLTATAACLKHTQGGGIRRWASSRFSFTYIIYYTLVLFWYYGRWSDTFCLRQKFLYSNIMLFGIMVQFCVRWIFFFRSSSCICLEFGIDMTTVNRRPFVVQTITRPTQTHTNHRSYHRRQAYKSGSLGNGVMDKCHYI